ncbi:MAG TPA: hypothetical protein PKC28_01795, partial [Bdellovibrionales bacterium]|nr:hypothetical protein [Bdellovibrionales bacterium]
QQAGGRGTAQISERGVKEDDGQPKVMQISGGMGGGKEMSDVPDQALLSLLNDCYWTEADGYAHYIWTQMTQEQREKVLTSGQIDPQYFSHVRQVSPVNLNYHTDARYLMFGRDFQAMNQADLSEWLKKNPNLFYRVTPLRWDLLPLSLEDRIRFNEMKVEQKESSEPLKLAVKSKPRLLQSKLHVRVLRGEDEEFLWRNSDRVPEHVR